MSHVPILTMSMLVQNDSIELVTANGKGRPFIQVSKDECVPFFSILDPTPKNEGLFQRIVSDTRFKYIFFVLSTYGKFENILCQNCHYLVINCVMIF